MSTPTPRPLSPEAAAQLAGVSRRTIMRALKAQEIKALRDNHGRWRIDAQSFENWADAHGHRARAHMTAHGQRSDGAQSVPTSLPTPSMAELIELRADKRHLEERLAAAETTARREGDRAARAEAAVASLEVERGVLREQVARASAEAAREREHADEWRGQAQALAQLHAQAQALAAQPWWRRWLGGPVSSWDGRPVGTSPSGAQE